MPKPARAKRSVVHSDEKGVNGMKQLIFTDVNQLALTEQFSAYDIVRNFSFDKMIIRDKYVYFQVNNCFNCRSPLKS